MRSPVQRLAALQSRLIELEKNATEKQVAIERLTETVAQEEAQRSEAEKQWALETENRRAAEALAARQKTDFDTRTSRALQVERKASEDALQARLLELRDTLAARAADIQKLELQLKETEQARAAAGLLFDPPATPRICKSARALRKTCARRARASRP